MTETDPKDPEVSGKYDKDRTVPKLCSSTAGNVNVMVVHVLGSCYVRYSAMHYLYGSQDLLSGS